MARVASRFLGRVLRDFPSRAPPSRRSRSLVITPSFSLSFARTLTRRQRVEQQQQQQKRSWRGAHFVSPSLRCGAVVGTPRARLRPSCAREDAAGSRIPPRRARVRGGVERCRRRRRPWSGTRTRRTSISQRSGRAESKSRHAHASCVEIATERHTLRGTAESKLRHAHASNWQRSGTRCAVQRRVEIATERSRNRRVGGVEPKSRRVATYEERFESKRETCRDLWICGRTRFESVLNAFCRCLNKFWFCCWNEFLF